MIKIERIDVHGFESAIVGMRNPMNSWSKSDSEFYCGDWETCENCRYYDSGCNPVGTIYLGENDLDLMKRLFKGGAEHRKYLRFIDVTMDITAPLYWWKEFDTYKIGTVANSCSTMHKIHSKEFELDDFSHEHLIDTWFCDGVEDESVCFDGEYEYVVKDILGEVMIPVLNECRQRFINTKNKKWWLQIIQLLPSSYNQKRTIKLNYEVAVNIIRQRKGHKLDEWHVLCDELMKLPYLKEIMGM